MNKFPPLLILALSGWLIVGCAADGSAQRAGATPAAEDVQRALTEAEAAYRKAYAVEYAWRDTEALLDSAKEAAAKGEHDKALELARQVKIEGDMAYAQYQAAKKAGPRY